MSTTNNNSNTTGAEFYETSMNMSDFKDLIKTVDAEFENKETSLKEKLMSRIYSNAGDESKGQFEGMIDNKLQDIKQHIQRKFHTGLVYLNFTNVGIGNFLTLQVSRKQGSLCFVFADFDDFVDFLNDPKAAKRVSKFLEICSTRNLNNHAMVSAKLKQTAPKA